MNKEIENLIRKSMAKDVEIKMIEREIDGLIISKEVILEILSELTGVAENTGSQPVPSPYHNGFDGGMAVAS